MPGLRRRAFLVVSHAEGTPDGAAPGAPRPPGDSMKPYTCKGGTLFWYDEDLTGRIVINTRADERFGLTIPAEDFMEFAAFLSSSPPWDPVLDDYDHATELLMIEHVDKCKDCRGHLRCDAYWLLILERVKEKEKRRVH